MYSSCTPCNVLKQNCLLAASNFAKLKRVKNKWLLNFWHLIMCRKKENLKLLCLVYHMQCSVKTFVALIALKTIMRAWGLWISSQSLWLPFTPAHTMHRLFTQSSASTHNDPNLTPPRYLYCYHEKKGHRQSNFLVVSVTLLLLPKSKQTKIL